jgi:TOBE domain
MVESVSFMGDSLECLMRVGGETLRAKLNPTDEIVAQSAVHVHIPPRRCVVMPKEE